MVTVDLHTHSILSHDGGLDEDDYKRVIALGKLQYIAITDHNEVEFAKRMQDKIGNAIIVGEEIMTQEGEIIGLFLKEKIEPNLSVLATVTEIKKQNGLVYIPHPFETVRNGLAMHVLTSIFKDIDIIETFNGRGIFTNKNREIEEFLARFSDSHSFATAASSDAHCVSGTGTSYSIVASEVVKENLVVQLREGTVHATYAPLYSLLCPKMNVLRKLL